MDAHVGLTSWGQAAWRTKWPAGSSVDLLLIRARELTGDATELPGNAWRYQTRVTCWCFQGTARSASKRQASLTGLLLPSSWMGTGCLQLPFSHIYSLHMPFWCSKWHFGMTSWSVARTNSGLYAIWLFKEISSNSVLIVLMLVSEPDSQRSMRRTNRPQMRPIPQRSRVSLESDE